MPHNGPMSMSSTRRHVLLGAVGLGVAATFSAFRAQAQDGTPTPSGLPEGQETSPQIVAAANAFLGTLTEAERETVLFDWSDSAQKQRWSNFPDGAFERAGLMWGNLGTAPQDAWLALMHVTLSSEGYDRVLGIWHADDAVAANDNSGVGGGPPAGSPPAGGGTPPTGGTSGERPQVNFGSAFYYLALIGVPSETDPWQWQFGGHHLAINATVVGPDVSLTPSFIGVEPFEYTDVSGNAVRPLGDIEDQAGALMAMLNAEQRQTAVLGDAPIDLVLGPGQDGKTLQSEGLPGSAMTHDQQTAFLQVIGHYAGLGNAEIAAARIAEVAAGIGETYLAWYGPTEPGNAAYFRVTGPTVVIEYSPQGAVPGTAPTGSVYHIHGIYRDPSNEYGAKYTCLEITS